MSLLNVALTFSMLFCCSRRSLRRRGRRWQPPQKRQNGCVTDTMLSFPWEAATSVTASHESRIVAHSTDRVAWLRARSFGVTATDAARLASSASVHSLALEKLHGSGFAGNAYTDHGTAREPEIARWVLAEHGIAASCALFHAEAEKRHLATPDGVAVTASGSLELAEIKTTTKAWRSIPRGYLRQVWWQQYVLGAERTLVVWEQHRDFVPVSSEPECRWVDRDDNEIHMLVTLANRLLGILSRQRGR